jgi:tetratricopeptide (TPR) repeat protein
MLGNRQKSVDDCTEAIRAQSDCAEAYFYRGLANLAGSHYYRAIANLEEAERLDESLNDSIEAPLAEAYFHWSKVLAKRGDAAAAATAMQESRLLDATYVDRRPTPYTFDDGTLASADGAKPYEVLKYIETAPHGLGMKFLAAKEYDKAIEQFTLAIRDNPYDYPAYMARGKAFLARQLAENAIDDFDTMVRKQHTTAEVYVLRARAYAMIDDHRLSRDDATQAIQLKPAYAPAFRVRGEAYLERGKYDLAIRDFGKAIGISPELKAELDPLMAEAQFRRAASPRKAESETAAVRDLLRARDLGREGS